MQKMKKLMSKGDEIFWINDKAIDLKEMPKLPYTKKDIKDAEARLKRFAPYLETAFPETKASKGIIESELTEIPNMAKELGLNGKLYLKRDCDLPISGSVKARGGIYEVLKLAEKIAIENNMLTLEDDYSKLADNEYKELFSKYSVAVGSTGNLGLSIGIISAKLGFSVTVHMSKDARQWKKDLLREKGATVIEYDGDYAKAVAQGREEAEKDPMCHFVDDENSLDLFMGYAVAGKRLAKQLKKMDIAVDKKHPLCIYIPCGVGGAPGGITFGIKTYLGADVNVYFAEPTMAPCMTLGLLTGEHEKIAINYIGIRMNTIADGLAVGRPSALVSKVMDKILNGSFTVKDERLIPYVQKLYKLENQFIEPSSAAGFFGVPTVDASLSKNATHIVWATGGSMVPDFEREKYLSGDGK